MLISFKNSKNYLKQEKYAKKLLDLAQKKKG